MSLEYSIKRVSGDERTGPRILTPSKAATPGSGMAEATRTISFPETYSWLQVAKTPVRPVPMESPTVMCRPPFSGGTTVDSPERCGLSTEISPAGMSESTQAAGKGARDWKRAQRIRISGKMRPRNHPWRPQRDRQYQVDRKLRQRG